MQVDLPACWRHLRFAGRSQGSQMPVRCSDQEVWLPAKWPLGAELLRHERTGMAAGCGALKAEVTRMPQAKESFAKMQPPEVRILKHLLTLEDPAAVREGLAAAFEPGPPLETEQQDFLSTCVA